MPAKKRFLGLQNAVSETCFFRDIIPESSSDWEKRVAIYSPLYFIAFNEQLISLSVGGKVEQCKGLERAVGIFWEAERFGGRPSSGLTH